MVELTAFVNSTIPSTNIETVMLSRESLFEKLLVKLDHWHEKLFGVIGHLIFGQILLKPIIWGESFHTKSNAPSFRMVLFEVSDFHTKRNIIFASMVEPCMKIQFMQYLKK